MDLGKATLAMGSRSYAAASKKKFTGLVIEMDAV